MADPATFGSTVRRLREQRGWTLDQLAARIPMDTGYLSKVERGLRVPTGYIADQIDKALTGGGTIAALLPAPVDEPGRPLDADDVVAIRKRIGDLVAADIAVGADRLHAAAAREFRHLQRRLAAGEYDRAHGRDLHAAAGELGEVAGWLLFDAGNPAAAGRAMRDGLLLTQLSGDRGIELLQTSLLAMLASKTGRHGEALALADRGLWLAAPGGRVEATFRLRRGRALADLGSTEGLDELCRARVLLETGDGPAWSWWMHPSEVALHQSMARAALGDHAGSVDGARDALLLLPLPQVRDRCAYLLRMAAHAVKAGAWSEATSALGELGLLAPAAGSGRMATELRGMAADLALPSRVRDAAGLVLAA